MDDETDFDATHDTPDALFYRNQDKAEAWDEGFKACYEWIETNPGISGIWSDPPLNPYEED